MNKSTMLGLVLLLGTPSLTSAQQALQVVRVNTADPVAYLDWAEASAPTLLADNVGAIGTCVPRFGADDPGDLYYFTASPNMEALLALDLDAPAVQREVAKVADLRTVVSRDVFVGMRVAEGAAAGTRWAQATLFVDTTQPARYVELLAEQERALHANGFDDVTWTAYFINTGVSAGQIVASLQAPSSTRLGAALDAVTTAEWSNFTQGVFNDIRTIEHSLIFDCAVHASNQ